MLSSLARKVDAVYCIGEVPSLFWNLGLVPIPIESHEKAYRDSLRKDLGRVLVLESSARFNFKQVKVLRELNDFLSQEQSELLLLSSDLEFFHSRKPKRVKSSVQDYKYIYRGKAIGTAAYVISAEGMKKSLRLSSGVIDSYLVYPDCFVQEPSYFHSALKHINMRVSYPGIYLVIIASIILIVILAILYRYKK